jgi:outer membrane lipoprotein LolB
MEKGLGWSLDLKGLRYWIRGIPFPDNEHEFSLDGQGRMSTLMQSGFTIDIQRYENIAQYALPKKMKIVGQALELKLIIKEWQLSSN